tara:strand:+ start:25509 stop:25733 length:225 start_codon:yes stop_codon:yes gene_type:complete
MQARFRYKEANSEKNAKKIVNCAACRSLPNKLDGFHGVRRQSQAFHRRWILTPRLDHQSQAFHKPYDPIDSAFI